MKASSLSLSTCILLIIAIVLQTSMSSIPPSSQIKISRSFSKHEDTATINQDVKLRHRTNLNKIVSQIQSVLYYFPKRTLKRPRRISKRSGVHPSKISEHDESFVENSTKQFSELNFTQTESVRISPPFLEPKFIDETTLVLEPILKGDQAAIEEPISVDKPPVEGELAPVVGESASVVGELPPVVGELPPIVGEPVPIAQPINFVEDPTSLEKPPIAGELAPIVDELEPFAELFNIIEKPSSVEKSSTVGELAPIVEPNVAEEPVFVKEPLPVVETTEATVVREPIFVDEETLVGESVHIEGPVLVEHLVPEIAFVAQTLLPVVHKLSLLDIDYDDDEDFWFIIEQTYREVCGTRCGDSDSDLHGGSTGLCAKCWCDTACSVYGDCCPNFYMKHGHTPPLDTAVQGCRSVKFPDTGKDNYRMINACADSEILANLEHHPKTQNETSDRSTSNPTRDSLAPTTTQEMSKAERMCLTPDPNTHWNQTRPITDHVTGLVFANQYCAVCSGVNLQTSTPWKISVITTSSTLFSTTSTVLDIYRTVMTSDEAEVFYEPPLPVHNEESTVRDCRNINGVSEIRMHLSRCNQTGEWRQYSRAAERACLMLNIPIYPNPAVYSYRNVYCYYCNHDVTWDKVLKLNAASPSIITGPGSNVLSVLLDLDGSDEQKFLTSDQEQNSVSVTDRKCNVSQFYDQVKDECREMLCAPGKFPTDNQTCTSNPSQQSNVFGYMACYLVTGIPGGRDVVSDLASRLAQEPHLVSDFGPHPTTGGDGKNLGPDYQRELSESLRATVVKTTRWGCNSCGLLGQSLDSASLLVQVAWASQSVLDRNSAEQVLVQAEESLIQLLHLTASALPGAAFFIGNLTVVKYPYCSIEENPVPSSRVRALPPPIHSGQLFVPTPCLNADGVVNQSRCAIDLQPSVRIPPWVYTQRGELRNYVNLVQYLPVNDLLNCQYVKVPKEEYTFNIQDWTVRMNHCETEVSASGVTISDRDGTMFVCLKHYVCWTRSKNIQNTYQDTDDDLHDFLLRWISLICTLLSMLCCLITFLTYACLPQLRSSAGINNMILAFLVFFAQGLAQFGSSQKDTQHICSVVGVLTHFFWLAAVSAMSTATYHMFYALSFPLRFQQYHGREAVLLRVYVALILLLPVLLIASTMLYAELVEGNFGYASGRNCFVNAGVPRIVFFGAPVLILVLLNTGMFAFTVARLHGTPNIGETKIRRYNAVLYSKLSVATGASWIFGFLYEWTDFVVFAYAYMLTALLLGLFLLLAFVTNKRVMDMARVKMPDLLAKLMVTRGDSSASQTTLKKTKSTSLA